MALFWLVLLPGVVVRDPWDTSTGSEGPLFHGFGTGGSVRFLFPDDPPRLLDMAADLFLLCCR